MINLLLISDDLIRTERLARDLGVSESSWIYDLYDDNSFASLPKMIVSDVKVMTSEAVFRLRRLLARVRSLNVPYLCLFHDSGARNLAQVNLLGASSLLSASTPTRHLIDALADLQDQVEPISLVAQQHADRARQFLREAFLPNRPLTPYLADAGTDIVTNALRETGIRTWVRLVRRFDDATEQHCLLVAGLASAFATSLGLSAADCHHLAKAALLHDVGKMHVPTAILNKPGKLDASEMALMRTHAERGHAMLVGCGFDAPLLAVVRSHHEMLDGSGYPDGLNGDEIPDLVRLVTICDVYGALIEQRPYRPAMPSSQASAILAGMSGRLDPDLLRAFSPISETFTSWDQKMS